MCVWDRCPFGTPNCNQDRIFRLMTWGFLKESGDNSPSAKQPHSMILPAPCLTVGLILLGLKALPSLLQTYCRSLFVSSDQSFLQEGFFFGHKESWVLRCLIWSKGFCLARQPLSSYWCKTHLTVDTDPCLPAASNSLHCFLVLDDPDQFFLSSRWWFCSLPDCGSDKTYRELFAQLIVWPVTALKWLQVTFLTFSN